MFIMYEYVLKETGERHRNVEMLTVRDDQVVETQVLLRRPVLTGCMLPSESAERVTGIEPAFSAWERPCTPRRDTTE